jgi:tRNA(Ile)-lysidine synthase
MNLLSLFQQHIRESGLFQPADKLLIAVSGGIDSVVLTNLCYQSGYHISLAHMNFSLRGEESDRDEAFVRNMAARLSVPLFVQRVDTKTYALDNKLSIQEAARILRYSWFRELMIEHQPLKYLLTAHHADDNIETVLMNLFRGTGISGLRGILPRQDNIIRPLLFATRASIESYAREQHIDFVEDSSNSEEKYTRNFFRLKVIPLIEKAIPFASENMYRNIERFSDVEILYRSMVDLKRNKLLQEKNGEWHIPVEKLRKEKPLKTLVFEVFSEFGFSAAQTGEIINLMDSPTGKFLLSSTHRLLKNRNWFIITALQKIPGDLVVVPEPVQEVAFSKGRILITEKKYNGSQNLDTDANTALLDTNAVVYPLIIRQVRTGDYFYPLGMRKKKKLSRFFIDRKLSLPEKENAWVVESGGRIIWVIGHRIDDRCRIEPHTLQMTVMRFIKTPVN